MHVMIELTIALLFLGIFAGLLSGFFGIGSGIILVPAYIFLFEFLNFPNEIIPFLATGTSMTTMALVIPNAARTHFKNGNVWYSADNATTLRRRELPHLLPAVAFFELMVAPPDEDWPPCDPRAFELPSSE